ncbi:MAG TPA: glutaredoxin 3 [Afifellaceae bacterium]|nr:glutaredoxin 3 [Afifellaceae bacterium]
MAGVTIYTRQFCGYCQAAKSLLERNNVAFEEIDATFSPELRREMAERSGRTTYPQVFAGDRHVGGYDELITLERNGELDDLLGSVA